MNRYNLQLSPLLSCLNRSKVGKYDNVWIKLSVRHLNIVFSFPPLGEARWVIGQWPPAPVTAAFYAERGSKLISPSLHKPICPRPAQRGGTCRRDCFTRVPSISTFPYIICLASCSTFILYKQTFIQCRWNFNIGEAGLIAYFTCPQYINLIFRKKILGTEGRSPDRFRSLQTSRKQGGMNVSIVAPEVFPCHVGSTSGNFQSAIKCVK